MTASSTPLGVDFPKQIVEMFANVLGEETRQVARVLWGMLTNFLSTHWLAVLLVLFVVFVAVTLKAMMGRWGSLGSFLYNFIYFGVLLIVGLIWGPEVFVGDYFKVACAVVLYPICYWVVGLILDKMGVRRRS